MTIGVVLAASGADGVIGSAVASSLFKLVNYGLLQAQMIVWSVTFGCLSFFGSHSFWVFATAMASLGFAGALGNIAIDTFLALYAGPMLARVLSVDRLTSLCAVALGPALSGALFASFGAQFAVRVLFLQTLVLVAATLLVTIPGYFRHQRADSRRVTRLAPFSIGSWPRADGALPSAWPELWYLVSHGIGAVTWGPAHLLSPQELQEAKGTRPGTAAGPEA
jgi:MFS family permease